LEAIVLLENSGAVVDGVVWCINKLQGIISDGFLWKVEQCVQQNVESM
jgi:hypothetical protein